VVAALTGLHQHNASVGPQNCKGKSWKAGSRAEIGDRRELREHAEKSCGVQNEPAHDGRCRAVSGKVDALVPTSQKQG
jgi:hypothetical protein